MNKKQKKLLYRIIAAVILVIALELAPVDGWLKFALYLIPYLIIGYETLVKAVKGIKNRQPFDENFLMAVATIGAIALGDFREGVSVMVFYQIGELFENIAVGKSRRSIGQLMDIRPDYANIEDENGQLVRHDPDEIAIGTVIVVQQDKPGVVAHITRVLSDKGVNIAFMRLFREAKGHTAYTIVESDGRFPEGIEEPLRDNPNVRDVMIIEP